MKRLQEDHKEISSGKRVDDEGYMARNELDSIERAVKNLRMQIKSGKQQLPAWVQSKITKAADYIDTASEYLQSDEKVSEGKILKGFESQIKKSSGAGALTPDAAKQLGPKAVELQKKKAASVSLPTLKKEEISLVEKILGEEKCGKGMYWCNTDKVCKPMSEGMKVPGQKIKPTEVGIGKGVEGQKTCSHSGEGKYCPVHGKKKCPMSEERDPKGPTQPYKSPEEIAKLHGVSLALINKQLEMGIKVEYEHTSDKSKARMTALQHLEEVPNYYSKLKKMETQKESVTIEDMYGNPYVEFVDLIKPNPIKEGEDPCWKGYTQVGMKMKNGKKVPNCVPSKGVPKAKGYKKESVDEAVRIPAQTGNNMFVTLSWRGKYYTIQLFFPQSKVPTRNEISDEIQKIYPNSRVISYRVADLKPGEPIIMGGSAGKLGPNKNYVKPMGEEREIEPPREKLVTDRNMYSIPKSEQEEARKRLLAKAAAKRKEREMKNEEVEILGEKK